MLALCLSHPAWAQPVDVSRPPYPAAVMRRAEALLAAGDISAARRLYRAAASDGVGAAATAMGRTYDPAELRRMGAVGLDPDPAEARKWYARGVELGDPDAQRLLQALAR